MDDQRADVHYVQGGMDYERLVIADMSIVMIYGYVEINHVCSVVEHISIVGF